MATRSSLLGDGHDAVPGAWDGSAHEQQIALGVHPDDGETELGVTSGTHMTGHSLTLDDTGGGGARADGAGLPMPGVAVGGGPAAEVVAVHHTLKAAPLGGAGDLDQFPRS